MKRDLRRLFASGFACALAFVLVAIGLPFAEQAQAQTYDFEASSDTFTSTPIQYTFGASTIPEITATVLNPIADVILPAFSGGTGAVTYAISPALPEGLTFQDDASMPNPRLLSGAISGTPADDAGATTYTYTATDADGDEMSLDFTITVTDDLPRPPTGLQNFIVEVETEIGPNNQVSEFTGGSGMLTYSLATGTTLPTGFSFGSDGTIGGTTPGTNMDDATDPVTYTYIATDEDGDTAEATFTIAITDGIPSFGTNTIDDISLVPGEELLMVVLPDFTGGTNRDDSTLEITPAFPTFLMYDANSRELSGMAPAETAEDDKFDKTEYTYTATDEDEDTDTLTFTIEVLDAIPEAPVVPNYTFTQDVAIPSTVLPAFTTTTTHNPELTYRVSTLPMNLMFAPDTRTISGTPAVPSGPQMRTTTVTYTATDGADELPVTFDITIVAGTVPTFSSDDLPIPEIAATVGTDINPVRTLPAITNGDTVGAVTYSITPAPPAGLTFQNDASMSATFLQLSGAITGTASNDSGTTTYIYSATSDTDPTISTRVSFNIVVTDSVPEFFDGANIRNISVINNSAISTTTTLPAATVNTGTGTVSYSITPTLPNGLTFQDDSSMTATFRELSGTPSVELKLDPTPFTYIATDEDGDTATLTFFITILEDLMPISPGPQTLVYLVGQDIYTGDRLSFTSGNLGLGGLFYHQPSPPLPAGLEFDDEAGIFYGTIADTANNDSLSETSYTYRVRDTDRDEVSNAFTLEVIDVIPVAPAVLDYSFSVGAAIRPITLPQFTNPVADQYPDLPHPSVTLSVSGLPDGLVYDPVNRRITGTPTTADIYPVTYTASDGADTDSVSFEIIVNDSSMAFDTTATATTYIEAMVRNSTIEVTLPQLSNSTGTVTYAISPALPEGVTFDAATRLLSGTILGTSEDDAGARTFTYTATDARSVRRLNLILVVTDVMPDFGEATIDDISIPIGTELPAVTLPESAGSGAVTYTLVPDLPTGLEFDADTRMITGTTPDDVAGDQSVDPVTYTYTATDADGDTATRTFAIEVLDAMPEAPTLTIYTFTQDVPIPSTVLPLFTTTTTHNPELTYSVSTLPMGLMFAPDSRTISGTPAAPSDPQMPLTTVTYTAYESTDEDENGDTDSVTFTITIVAGAVPTFGSMTIPDIAATVRMAIDPVTFPQVTPSDPNTNYILIPDATGGLMFDRARSSLMFSGMVNGTPEDDSETRTYIYRAVDINGNSAHISFDLVITDELLITDQITSLETTGFEPETVWVVDEDLGQGLFSVSIPDASSGSGAPFTFDFGPEMIDLPQGVTTQQSGKRLSFSGTPSAAFPRTKFTVNGRDVDGDPLSYSFYLTVEENAQLVAPRQPQNFVFAVGTPINQVLLPFIGGNGDLTYSLHTDSPALPQGLTFDANTRRISGEIADTAMDQNALPVIYTYEGRDSDGDMGTASFIVTISDAIPEPPTVEDLQSRQHIAISSTTPLPVFTSTTGHNPDLTYSLTARGGGALPEWLRFDAETRTILGRTGDDLPLPPPSDAGAFPVSYTATDGQDSTSADFHIIITPNQIPMSPTIANGGYTFAVGQEVGVTLPLFNGGDGIITYSLTDGTAPVTSLVGGLTFTLADRTISGTVPGTVQNDDSVSATTYTYSATDSDGDSGSGTFTITIRDDIPDFGSMRIAEMTIIQYSEIMATLPEVETAGTGETTYSVRSSRLPPGLMFDADTRTFSGAPTGIGLQFFQYVATDTDGDISTLNGFYTVVADSMPVAPSADSLTFVFRPGADLTGSMAIMLPDFTGGNGVLMYEVGEPTALGDVLTLNETTRTISGTLAADTAEDDSIGPISVPYIAIDEDGDRTPTTYTIEVVDFLPVAVNIPDLFFLPDEEVDFVMPEFDTVGDMNDAIGDSPTLTYRIDRQNMSDLRDLAGELMFDPATRRIHGTAIPESGINYTYIATDGVDEVSDEFSLRIENIPSVPLPAPVVDYYVFQEGEVVDETLPAFTGGTTPLMYILRDTFDDAVAVTLTLADIQFGGLMYEETADGRIRFHGPAALPSARDNTDNSVDVTYYYRATDSSVPVRTGTAPITIRILDAMPDFGTRDIDDITEMQHSPFTAVTLPEVVSSGTGDTTYSLAPDLPAGLVFDANTRMLSGMPTVNFGIMEYTYTATDTDGDSDTITFDITVTENMVPVFNPTSLDVNVVAGGMDFAFEINGNPATLTELPVQELIENGVSGASFPMYEISEVGGSGMYALGLMVEGVVGTDAQFVGPVEDTPGDDTTDAPVQIFLTATDADGNQAVFTYNFSVSDPRPVAPTSITGAPFTVGRSQAVTLGPLPAFGYAAGETAPTLVYSATGLPDGLSLNASRQIVGTTTAAATSYTITYTATDAVDVVSTEFVINVVDALPDFPFETFSNISAIQNERLLPFALPQVNGGMGTIVYSLSPALPSGLSFDPATRAISGTPSLISEATTYTYTATDTAGQSDSLTFDITVAEDLMPSYSPTANRTITLIPGATIDSADVRFPSLENLGNEPYSTAFTPAMDALPVSWLMFDAGMRAFSGTVPMDEAGDGSIAPFAVTQTITDYDFDVASVTFTFVVIDTMPLPPTVPNYEVSVNQLIQRIVLPQFTTVVDDNSDVMPPEFTYTLVEAGETTLPSWLNFDPSTRVISGAGPTTAGTTTLTYTATDGFDMAMVNFDIVAVDDARPVAPAIPNGGFVFGLSETVDETLPPFAGGNGALTHRLTDGPPTETNDVTTLIGGLSYDPANRRIHGTINITDRAGDDGIMATTYTYSATDSDTDNPDTISTPFTITIEDDIPSFGPLTAPNFTIQQHNSMSPVTLPVATGGMGTLVYSLSPTLPDGLSFNARSRVLSGTPSQLSEATTYTYRVTDAVGDFAAQTFTITVTEDRMPRFGANADEIFILVPSEDVDATFPEITDNGGNYGDGEASDHTATVSPEPNSNRNFGGDWAGLELVGRDFTGTALVDTNADDSSAPFRVTRTVTDADGDAASVTFTFVLVDPVPTMPRESIPNYQFAAGALIDPIVLPQFATRADDNPRVASPTLTYTLVEEGGTGLPSGLSFARDTRTLFGTPDTAGTTTLSYTATDSTGPDSASVTFTIEVVDTTALVAPVIPNGGYVFNPGDDVNVQLPEFTGGTGSKRYSLFNEDGTTEVTTLIGGLAFNKTNRRIIGLIAADRPRDDSSVPAVTYTYRATDSTVDGDGNPVPLMGEVTFTVAIEDAIPTFGSATVDNMTFHQHSTIAPITLPAATGGNQTPTQPLAYSIRPDLVPGLSFDSETRILSGTPSPVLDGDTVYNYAYRVVDIDGDTPLNEDGDPDPLTFTITVIEDLMPRFPANADKTYVLNPGQDTDHVSFPRLLSDYPGNEPLADPITTPLPHSWVRVSGRSFAGTTAPADTAGDDSVPPFTVTRTITDADGDSASVTFTFEVIDSVPTVPLEDIPDYDVSVGFPLQRINLPEFATSTDDYPTAEGSSLLYSLTEQGSDMLPDWLNFNILDGSISGTGPTEAGTTTLTYTATDEGGESSSVNFDLVATDDLRPVVPTITNYRWRVGETVDVTLPAFTSGDGNLTYRLRKVNQDDTEVEITSETPLFRGLSWDPATREITGTVEGTVEDDIDFFDVIYLATDTDDDGMHDTTEIAFSVTITDDIPSLSPPSDRNLNFNQYSAPDIVFPEGTGGTGELTYSFIINPPGLTFNPTTRRLEGRMTFCCEEDYTYRVTDEDGDFDEIDYTFQITAGTPPTPLGYPANSDEFITLAPGDTVDNKRFPGLASNAMGHGALTNRETIPEPDPNTNTWPSPWDWLESSDDRVGFSGTAPAETAGDDTIRDSSTMLPQQFAVTRRITDSAEQTASVTFTFEVIDFLPELAEGSIPEEGYTVSIGEPLQAVVLPEFTTANDDHPRVTRTLTYSLAPEGGGSLPDWLTFQGDPAMDNFGSLTGMPPSGTTPGPITLKYSAADGIDEASVTFDITVVEDPRPQAPTISNGGYVFDVGEPISEVLPAFTGGNGELTHSLTDENGNEITLTNRLYADGSVPDSGLSFDPASRTISGTIPDLAGDDGVIATTYTYSATDTDADGMHDTETTTFTITVMDDVPNFGTETVNDFAVRETIMIPTVTLPVATGGTGELTYSLSPLASTIGLSFDANSRQITGTPNVILSGEPEEDSNFTYTATDEAGDTATLTFTVVRDRNETPNYSHPDRTFILGLGGTVTGVSFPRINTNPPNVEGAAFGNHCPPGMNDCLDNSPSAVSYSVSFSVDGSSTKLESLPPEWSSWLIYTHTNGTGGATPGRFSGTVPAEMPGNQSMTLAVTHTATDYDEETDSITYTFMVVDPDPTVPREDIPDYDFVLNEPIEPIILPEFATNVDDIAQIRAPFLEYSLVAATGSAFPSWLEYHIGSRTLSGTPNANGETTLSYTATDEAGDTATETFTITVAGDTLPVAPTETQAFTFTVGQENTEELAAFTRGNGELTYALMPSPALPDGLEFVAASREITGTVLDTADDDSVNAATYTYTATDIDGDPVTATFTITVVDSIPQAPMDPQAFVFAPGDMIALGAAIDPATNRNGALLAFTGGDGALTYTLSKTSFLHLYGLEFSDNPLGFTGMIYADTQVDDSIPFDESADGLPFTYIAMDAGGDRVGSTFTIQIIDPKPVAPAVTNRSFEVDIPIVSHILPAFPTNVDDITEIVAPTLTYSLTLEDGTPVDSDNRLFADASVPGSGLTFDPDTQALSGTPATETTTTVVYTATDDGLDEASVMFQIIVNDDPAPQPPTIANGGYTVSPGEEFTDLNPLELPAFEGGDGTLTYSLIADGSGTIIDAANPLFRGSIGGTQVPGLSFNPATRRLTGRVAGTSGDDDFVETVTYRATDTDPDGTNETGEVTFRITRDDSQPLPPPSATVQAFVWEVRTDLSELDDVAERSLVPFTDGDAPLMYAITGNLPSGITLDVDSTSNTLQFIGIVGGNVAVDQASYTYSATDVDGDVATATFTIEITDTTPDFGGATIEPITVVQNSPIIPVQLPAAMLGSGMLTYSITGLTATGLMFDTADPTSDTFRYLSGRATGTVGDTTLQYQVADEDGDQATPIEFTITVVANTPPTQPAAIEPLVFTPGQNVTETLTESTGGNGMLRYRLTPDISTEIPGLSFNGETRQITGTTAADDEADQDAGPITFNYTAIDDNNTDDTVDYFGGFTATSDDDDSVPRTFTIQIVDSKPAAPSGTQEFTIQVGEAVTGVTLRAFTIANDEGVEDRGDGAFTYALVTSTTDANFPDLPQGLMFDDVSLAITGTVTDTFRDQNDTLEITYSATDGNEMGDTTTATFTLQITEVVPVAPAPPAPYIVTLGEEFSATLPEFTGGDGALTYALSETPPLPAGLMKASDFGTSRMITGTVDDTAGNDEFDGRYSYTAEDPTGDVAEIQVRLIVNDPRPVAPENVNTLNLVLDREIDTPIQLPPFTYLHEDSENPPTLTVSLSPVVSGLEYSYDPIADRRATITGMPDTATGANPITVTYMATDGLDSDMVTFTVVVTDDPRPQAPTLPNDEFFTFTPGQMLPTAVGAPGVVQLPAFTIDDGTPVAGANLTYQLGTRSAPGAEIIYSNSLISGLTFNPLTRVIHGTVTATSDEDYAIQTYIYSATDNEGTLDDTEDDDIEPATPFTITIRDDIPTFASGEMIDPITAVVGSPIMPVNLPEVVRDSDGDPIGTGAITYTLTGESNTALPGLTFDDNSDDSASPPMLSGTPTEELPTTTFTYMAVDTDLDPAVLTFTITVAEDFTLTAPEIPAFVLVPGQTVDATSTPRSGILPAFTGVNGMLTYTLSDAADLTQFRLEYEVDEDHGPLISGLIVDDDAEDQSLAPPVSFTFSATDDNSTVVNIGAFMAADDDEMAMTTFTIEIVDAMPVAPTDEINPTFTRGINNDYMLPPFTTNVDDRDDVQAPDLTYSLTLADGNPHPDWLMFDTDDPDSDTYLQISGNPDPAIVTTLDPIMLTYRADEDQDGTADFAEVDFTLTITDDSRPVEPTNFDRAYSYAVGASVTLPLPDFTGEEGPFDYTLTDADGVVIDNGDTLAGGLAYTTTSNTRTIGGDITGTPADDSVDPPVTYTYRATETTDDDGTQEFREITFTIAITDEMPDFTGVTFDDIDIVVGSSIEPNAGSVFRLPAAAGTGTVTYTLTPALPADLTFDPNTRIISGEATAQFPTTLFTYTATDEDGDTDMATFTITVVNETPFVVPTPAITDRVFVVGSSPLDVDVTLPPFTGGNGTLTHSLTNASGAAIDNGTHSLIGGLQYNQATGEISGTIAVDNDTDQGDPAVNVAAPIYTYTVVDDDNTTATSDDDSMSLSFSIRVVDPRPVAPEVVNRMFSRGRAIETITLPMFGNNIPETLPPGMNIPAPTFTYSLTGTLPTGLEFDPQMRTLSGSVPDATSMTTVMYTATDGLESDSVPIVIEVVDDARPTVPTITGAPFNFVPSQPVTIELPDFGPGDGVLTYSLANAEGVISETNPLIGGLNYNSETRTITGPVFGDSMDNSVPTTTYTYTARDTEDTADLMDDDLVPTTFTITITDAIPAFASDASITTITGIEGTALSAPIALPSLETAGTGAITYTFEPGLPGLEFDTNEITGTPSSGASGPYTYIATDADGDRATVSFMIDIESLEDTTPVAPTIQGGGYTFAAGATVAELIPLFTGGNGALTHRLIDDGGNEITLTDNLLFADANVANSGLGFNPETGLLAGIVADGPGDDNAVETYTYSATDSDPDEASDLRGGDGPETVSITFTITITDDNLVAPELRNYMFTVGVPLDGVQLPAFDNAVSTTVYTLDLGVLASQLTFTATTRMLGGDPDTATDPITVTYTATTPATPPAINETDSGTFTIQILNVPTLEDATASAIPTVGANIALVASQAISSRVELALDGLSSGIDIRTLDGPSLRLNPQQQNGGSSGPPVRFGVWYSAASDSISDSRGTVAWSGTTDSTNLGFDVGFDISESASLVVGILQNSASTSATYGFASGEGSSSTLSMDLDSTAFYVGLGFNWLDAWFANGSADSTLTDSMRDMAIPASFSYQTIGLTAAFEVIDSLRIGGKLESLTSDLSLAEMEGEYAGLQTDSSQLRTTFVANYQLELGEKGNGLLIPKFEFGFRDLSLNSSITGPTTAVGGSAMETGFGLDYSQLAWGLSLGLDIRSISVENYSADSTQWQVRWESGNYGSGISFQLTPNSVSETLGGVDSLYSGGYNQYQSLLQRQQGGNSAAADDSKGMNFEVGYGIAAGYGTFTPYLKTNNYRGIGNRAEELGIRYQTLHGLELSLSAERNLTPQTVEILGFPLTFMQQESALTFSTRYSF